jgi:putative ABC transport system ATP-binding protein
MLSMRDLSRVYRADTVETTALDGIFLDVADGEFVAVMGPSGCGKSTLLNVIGMLDSPTSGSYMFNGTEVAGLSESKLADFRKRNIGFIFQSFNLVDELSVRENIELALLYHNVPAGERRTRVDEVMDKVGIAHRAKHRPSQLSGGQQQRVAVARAMVSKPAVVFADEPTGNLDSKASHDVLKLLRQAVDEFDQTVIMVTHDPEAATYADRLLTLRDGRIVSDAAPGTVDEVIELMKQLD